MTMMILIPTMMTTTTNSLFVFIYVVLVLLLLQESSSFLQSHTNTIGTTRTPTTTCRRRYHNDIPDIVTETKLLFTKRTTTIQKQERYSISTTTTLYNNHNNNNNNNNENEKEQEYRNGVTEFLSNFMQPTTASTRSTMPEGGDDVNDGDDGSIINKNENDPFGGMIDWQASKIPITTNIETLAQALNYELIQSEWFVTGKVNPSYFSNDFEFQDPDVKLKGIEEYAKGVNRLFDQSTSRAEIISTVVNTEATMTTTKPTITVTWRLSGGVNIGWGLTIKPYTVYTDFVIDPTTKLIIFQEDRFDLPSWDILLSSLFPFLIGKVTSPPSPPVPKRNVSLPKLG